MTQDQINFAFEGRWRVKGNFGQINAARACMSTEEFYDYIKDMCLDFFETGIIIAQRDMQPAKLETMEIEAPLTPEEAEIPPSCLVKESDMLTVEDTFNKWWDLYDKKCGKENCMKKWKKLSAKEQFACIAATPAYVAATPDKQFRKHPLTYLNQKAWNDEIINRNGNQPTIEQQRLHKLASILTD